MSTTITDETIGTGEKSGVVESDLAEDSEPDYAAMTDDEREAAVDALLEEGVTEAVARETVYGETEAEPEAKKKPEQLSIPGTISRISADPGGSSPSSSTAKMMGRSLAIEGEFEGDEIVALYIEAKVSKVEFVYKDGPNGETIVERRHQMRPVTVRRA